MKNLTKLTFALIALMLLFTACSKDDDDNSLAKDKKLASLVFPPNNEGKQAMFNYKYDDQGRLVEISEDNILNMSYYIFTYMPDGRVEKIKVPDVGNDQVKYIDYTFFYENESQIPNRIRYSGAVPTYIADVVNIDNTLFWKNKDGDEFVLEGVNTTNNTFQSFLTSGVTYTPHFNTLLKNGLSTQAVLNIPLAMTESYTFFVLYSRLQLNSQPLIRMETSDGELFNWKHETDAAGYITKDKIQGGIEYRYQ